MKIKKIGFMTLNLSLTLCRMLRGSLSRVPSRGLGALLGLVLCAPSYAYFPPLKDSDPSQNSQSDQVEALKVEASQKTSPEVPLENKVREAIDNSLQPFSGSILLTQNGKPLLNMHKGRGINNQSSFVIASLSKQITATLILQAVDAGKLQLDRSLNSYRFSSETFVDEHENEMEQFSGDEPASGFNAKFETRAETGPKEITGTDEQSISITTPASQSLPQGLYQGQPQEQAQDPAPTQSQLQTSSPEIIYGTSTQSALAQDKFNPNRFDERITLHHLLSHTSGIDKLGKPNHFEPGTQFQYSNYGYTVLGELLEQINQQSLSQQIADFKLAYQLGGLYAEVGSIDDIRQRAPALVIGLIETPDGLTPSGLKITKSLIPAGGIISTTTAFSNFQIKLHSGKFFSPQSYQLMTTPHSQIDFLWPNMSYGYGLRINTENNLTEYSHTGYLHGYMSMTLYYPQFNLGVVMLENISLNLNYLDRVFELHNQVRAIIRSQLISTQAQDVK